MSRKHLATRFDEDNCKPQCPGCNIFKYGEQYKFGQKLGSELAESLQIKCRQTIKISKVEYTELISYYKTKVNNFLKNISNTDYF